MYATRAHKRRVNNFETGDNLESSDVDPQMDGESADEISVKRNIGNSPKIVMTETRETASTSDNNVLPTQQPSFVRNSNTCRVGSNSHRGTSAEIDYSSQDEVRFIAPSVRNTPISTRARSPLVSARPPFYRAESENDEAAVERHMEKAGIVGTFKALIEEVTTTMTEMKSMVQKLNGKMSTCTGKKPRGKVYGSTHSNSRHFTSSTRSKLAREVSTDSSSTEDDDDGSCVSTGKTSSIIKDDRYSKTFGAKLPPFTGTEQWKVWHNRFESVANLNRWDEHEKLQQLLPRIQGKAAEFVYGQLKPTVTSQYKILVQEMRERFDVIETTKAYVTQFSRRNQNLRESAEEYAAELKRLYDRAYPKRGAETRQEDLLRRFLMGLHNNNARMHVELNKEPNTIEEAVHHVVHYFEAARNTNIGNHQEEDRDRYQRTRQVKPNKDHTENDHDVGQKTKHEETARQKKNEKPDQTEQPKKTEMICINKQDLEGMLKDIMADLKGKEQDSKDKIQFPGKPTGTNNENRRRIVCFACQEPGHISRNCSQRMNRMTDERQRGFSSSRLENRTAYNTNAKDFIPRQLQQLNCSGSAQ